MLCRFAVALLSLCCRFAVALLLVQSHLLGWPCVAGSIRVIFSSSGTALLEVVNIIGNITSSASVTFDAVNQLFSAQLGRLIKDTSQEEGWFCGTYGTESPAGPTVFLIFHGGKVVRPVIEVRSVIEHLLSDSRHLKVCRIASNVAPGVRTFGDGAGEGDKEG